MRNGFYLGVLLMLLGLIFLEIKFNIDVEDLEHEFEVERIMKDRKIEELEKEIRILKTDVSIIQYGFESEEEK